MKDIVKHESLIVGRKMDGEKKKKGLEDKETGKGDGDSTKTETGEFEKKHRNRC